MFNPKKYHKMTLIKRNPNVPAFANFFDDFLATKSASSAKNMQSMFEGASIGEIISARSVFTLAERQQGQQNISDYPPTAQGKITSYLLIPKKITPPERSGNSILRVPSLALSASQHPNRRHYLRKMPVLLNWCRVRARSRRPVL